MKNLFLVIYLFVLILPLEAQSLSSSQLDSLYNLFINRRTTNVKNAHAGIQSVSTEHIKCGFGIASLIRTNFSRFTTTQQAMLKTLYDRPSSDTSFVTPGGFFRVHFTKADTPDYIPDNIRKTVTTSGQMKLLQKEYLDSVAIALDSAYNFEVNYLGYPPPPSDNGAGGDNLYDIYISPDLGSEYGETDPEDEVISGSNRYTTYMMLNYNFKGFYTNGISAARVTTAHEFHHSIQAGNYILRYDLDEFFYELTSTSMEHFVYPEIRDYLQYLTTYFYNTQHSLGYNGTLQEYALAIWNFYLKDLFGYGIIKRQWELMPQMRALQAIANSIADYNTSFGEQFNKFGIWTYYTNYRTKPGSYFEDASYYPVVQPTAVLQMKDSTISINSTSVPVSNNFITFTRKDTLVSTKDSLSSKVDTLVTIITNIDIDNGISNTTAELPFDFTLYDYQQNGSTKLADNYYEAFTADKPAFWITSAILNTKVIDSTIYIVQNLDYAFPSPFNYKNNAFLYIPAQPDTYGDTFLNIYNVAMKLVYSTNQNVINYLGHKVLRWNGLDNQNKKLSTGVYIYVTKSNNEIKKGKLVILNE